MRKKQKIDLSEDRLMNLAYNCLSEKNYLLALKMVQRKEEMYFPDDESLMLTADILDAMQAPEACINAWFKFLACANEPTEDDLCDAYEGLSINYARIGNMDAAKFYYKKMLDTNVTGFGFEDTESIAEEIMPTKRSPLKITYPPELADYSEELQQGMNLMGIGKFKEAISVYEKVPQNNQYYTLACNHIVMCYIMSDELDKAYSLCNSLLDRFPDDVRTLVTYSAVLTEMGLKEESATVAKRLVEIGSDDIDDMFKIATVCCENKMHREALKIISAIDTEAIYDFNLTFFKAVSAFNCGEYEVSIDAFDKILTLNPHASIAKTLKMYAINCKNGVSERAEEMSYFYRLTESERVFCKEYFIDIVEKKQDIFSESFSFTDFENTVYMAIDDATCREDNELLYLTVSAIVMLGDYEMLSDNILLNAFLPDWIKMVAINQVLEDDDEFTFSYVIGGLFRKSTFKKLGVGRKKRKIFVKAYARLIARFGILQDVVYNVIYKEMHTIYNTLAQREKLDAVKDVPTLCAVVCNRCKLPLDGLEPYDAFSVKREKYSALLQALE